MNKVRPTIGNNKGGNMVRQTIRVRIEKAFDYSKAKFKQFERKYNVFQDILIKESLHKL